MKWRYATLAQADCGQSGCQTRGLHVPDDLGIVVVVDDRGNGWR